MEAIGKIGIKALLGVLLSFLFLKAQDISGLLEEYRKASELYRKTRKESLGHLILFTREDIERMQAYRLSDLLKSLRFFSLANNRFGILTLNEYGGYSPIPRYVRLYINDHEVSSLHTGSPFLVWENFPLDAVDHVEIYLGVGAIELGNDPAMVIIKVYTKEPSKENAHNLRVTGSSRKGYDTVFYSAYEIGSGMSYIFLLSEGFDNRKDYRTGSQELSRDGRYRFAYLGFYTENINVELGYGFIRKGPFIGFAVDNVAERGYTEAEDFYITLTTYPSQDRSLKFVFSLDNHRRKHFESSSTGLYIPMFMDPFNPLNNPRDFYEKAFFSKAYVYISKEFRSEKNRLLSALSYKLYTSDIDSRYYVKMDGSIRKIGETVPFDRQEIYSLILENKFSLNPKNLLIAGVKLDKYYRNGGFKDFEEYIARLGYITILNENLSLKGFLTRSYIPPYFYDTDISGRDLDTAKVPIAVTVEGLLKLYGLKLGFGAGYVRIEDALGPDSTGRIRNLKDPQELKVAFANVEREFDSGYKVQAGYSAFLEPENKTSPPSGGYIRIMSRKGRVDTFGELVFREGFTFIGREIEEGYDLTVGTAYRVSENMSVKMKGENLLGRASETPYLVPQDGSVVSYPVRERTVYLTLEWVF
jgi:iron complex outermembrane receptor protein